jgi:hypothetical protein
MAPQIGLSRGTFAFLHNEFAQTREDISHQDRAVLDSREQYQISKDLSHLHGDFGEINFFSLKVFLE